MSDFPRARQPVFNAPPVTMSLVLLIVAVWGILNLLPEESLWRVVATFAIIPARVAAVTAPGVDALAVLEVLPTLLTYALLHVELIHVLVNAGFLLAFGSVCERGLGRNRYAGLLLGSTVAGAAAQLAADWAAMTVILGASGAVAGCLGGVVRLAFTGPPHPARRRFAITMVAVMIGTNLLFALVGGALVGTDAGIAWQAHLGGFAAGLLLARR